MNKILAWIRQVVLFACAGLFSIAQAAPLNVLWYTYADPASEYHATISLLASTVQTLPNSAGQAWDLTYFAPGSATPDFAAYDVLVIESGEAFRTQAPGGPLATPNYSGILDNKAAIAAARGDRTFITSADADFHAVRGNTGNVAGYTCAPVISAPECWDGALGHVVNAVNWAGTGKGLGIVSFLDGEFDNSFWWMNTDSFLHDELSYVDSGGLVQSYVNYNGSDDHPIIAASEAGLALNAGLTSQGLSNWNHSFHAFFPDNLPGYENVVDSSLPSYALAIATMAQNAAPAAIDAPGTMLLLTLGLGLLAQNRRALAHSRTAAAASC